MSHSVLTRRVLIAGAAAAACSACAQTPAPAPAPVVAAPPPPPKPPTYAERLSAMGLNWTPPAAGKAVLVNVPSFDVVAFQDGEPVLTSRAIVGAPRTPSPIGEVRSGVVRFRPTWRPTPRMVREGLYEDGVRPAGPGNPLGLAAIRFDEGGTIYLHGTNKPKLFERERRALSSGCVRVERIAELSAFVLEWEHDQVLAAMQGRRSFDAQTAGLPIVFSYATRFALPDAEEREWPDIYGRA